VRAKDRPVNCPQASIRKLAMPALEYRPCLPFHVAWRHPGAGNLTKGPEGKARGYLRKTITSPHVCKATPARTHSRLFGQPRELI
jgi:hypothetical protein